MFVCVCVCVCVFRRKLGQGKPQVNYNSSFFILTRNHTIETHKQYKGQMIMVKSEYNRIHIALSTKTGNSRSRRWARWAS